MSQTQAQIEAALSPVVDSFGCDLEEATMSSAGAHSVLKVIVDRDRPIELDELADLSRDVSATLDAIADDLPAQYSLEVTTPGIGRPLTAPRHWRRNQGRKVRIDVRDADGSTRRIDGRIGTSNDDTVDVVINDRGAMSVQQVHLANVDTATVQVDFSRPGAAELEQCGLTDEQIKQRQDSRNTKGDK